MDFRKYRTDNKRNLQILTEATGLRELQNFSSALHRAPPQPKEDDLSKLLDTARGARDKLKGPLRKYLTHLIVKPLQFELKKIGPDQLDVAEKKRLQSELSSVKPANLRQFKQTRNVRDLFETKGHRTTVWAVLRRLAHRIIDAA